MLEFQGLSENWSFQMLETVCLKCINAAQPTRAKRTSVFSQFNTTVTFQWKEKGLRRGVHARAVICIMTVMNEPSASVREETPPHSTFGCILMVFIHGR